MDLSPAACVFDRKFIDQMPEIVAGLSKEVDDLPVLDRHWVFYGSQPLGAAQATSDLDVLLVHDEAGWPVHRRSAVWNGIPVTIYVLNRQDLYSDGADRRFGGYFALKLFGPFITDNSADESALASMVADFLAPIAHASALRWGRSSWSADQLVAHAHLAFLDLYPDAASYLARLHRDRELFRRVWHHQRAVYLTALQANGHVQDTGDGLWRYEPDSLVDDLPRERSRCAARFWACGAVFHESDPGFPDLYFHKADAAATRAEQGHIYRVLQRVVAGGVLP